MSDFIIRRAADQDIPGVLDLLVQVCMVHHNGRPDLFNGPATKYTAEELAVIFKDDQTPVFVAVDDAGHVLGHAFCIFKQNKGDHVLTDILTLYVDDICVDEAHRGMHVGNALYEHVQNFAKESGCYNLTLNVWTLNPTAMKFYENCGMVPQKVGMEKILCVDGDVSF